MLEWLRLPETRKICDLDDVATTILHGKIIQKKKFLKKIYIDFYRKLATAIPGEVSSNLLVEVGSGGGFLKRVLPDVITSDILELPGVDMRFSALEMPFAEREVGAYLMFDVFHHLPDAAKFLQEVERTLVSGGKMIAIEPANTPWSAFVYRNFHHEPFCIDAGWKFDSHGPLSSANGALPWIIFCRDRTRFEREYPCLKIAGLRFHTPFRYLASGGVSFRQFLPNFAYPLLKGAEYLLSPLNKWLGMFMTIVVEKSH